MIPHRRTIASLAFIALAACAQGPEHVRDAGQRMAMVDDRAKEMCALSDRFAKAHTPEERRALARAHARLLQTSSGEDEGAEDLPMRQRMMERRMDMMQCSMRMMMEQIPAAAHED